MPTKTILIAEDEAPLLHTLSYIFEKHDFSVLEAGDGEEAFSLLVAGEKSGPKIDLLITDIETPNMTGLALMDAMIKANITIPVMAISGYADKNRGGTAPPGLL